MLLYQNDHSFCLDCSSSLVLTSVRGRLIPACPHEKEQQCGAVPQPLAERVLNRWLQAAPASAAGARAEARAVGEKVLSRAERLAALADLGVRENVRTTFGIVGVTFERVDEVVLWCCPACLVTRQGACVPLQVVLVRIKELPLLLLLSACLPRVVEAL